MANVNHLTIVDAEGKFVVSPIIMMAGMKDGSIGVDKNKIAGTVQGVLLQAASHRVGDNLPLLMVCDGRDSNGAPVNVKVYNDNIMVVTNVGRDKKSYLIVKPQFYSICSAAQLLSIEGFIKNSARCMSVRVSGLDGERAMDRIFNPDKFNHLIVDVGKGQWALTD